MSLKIQFVPIIYNELGYNRIRAMSCYITQSALVFLILSEQYSSLHDKGEIYGIREAFKIRVPFGYFPSKSLAPPPLVMILQASLGGMMMRMGMIPAKVTIACVTEKG